MRPQAADALAAAAADRDEPAGRLEPFVVERGCVLNGEHDLLQLAALDHRRLMRLQDMVHGHAPVRQQPIGRLALRAGRKDRRDRGPRTVEPRPPDAHDPIPNPAIGMRAARVFPLGPIRAFVHVQRRRRADIAGPLSTQHRPPVRSQRLHPHRARQGAAAGPRRLARGRVRTAFPARRPIAGAGMVGADIAVGHHRAHLVRRLPVGRHAFRRQSQHPGGQTVNPHARQKQKAMVVDDLREVRGSRVRGPADEAVARLLVPARGAKPDTAKASMDRRTSPVSAVGRPARGPSLAGGASPSWTPNAGGPYPPTPAPVSPCPVGQPGSEAKGPDNPPSARHRDTARQTLPAPSATQARACPREPAGPCAPSRGSTRLDHRSSPPAYKDRGQASSACGLPRKPHRKTT